jgi:hypothetical protein
MHASTKAFLATLLLALPLAATAIESSFSYQGRLAVSGQPANGPYDLQFQLQDEAGAPIGADLLLQDVSVADGLFTVSLDFGDTVFTGAARYLAVAVREGDSMEAFTPLGPRTRIGTAPYAQVAGQAQFAATLAPDAITGQNVVDGSLGPADVSGLQARIATGCPAGQFMTGVDALGEPFCSAPPASTLSTYAVSIPFVQAQDNEANGCKTNNVGVSATADGPSVQLPAGTYLVTMPLMGSVQPVGGTLNGVSVTSSATLRNELRSASQLAYSVLTDSMGVDGTSEYATVEAPTRTFQLGAPTSVFVRAVASVFRCGTADNFSGRQVVVLRIGN